jgi:hypothetical protein
MAENGTTPERSVGEGVIAVVMAVVLLATAVAAWRASDLGSRAGDAERQGLIEAIKAEDLVNIDWSKTYEEATHAQRYLVTQAEVEALESSGAAAFQAQAANVRTYLLPNMALLAEPLASDPAYAGADGSLDLTKRFEDLQAQNAELATLDVQSAFTAADSYHAEQRWHVVGAVLLALSLFWLGLAEISRGRLRVVSLVSGVVVFVLGVAWLAATEVGWALARLAAS